MRGRGMKMRGMEKTSEYRDDEAEGGRDAPRRRHEFMERAAGESALRQM
jgi:hypothetical protein